MIGMRFFKAAVTADTPAGPAPAEMRGRAAEISDPGSFGWEVMWEALKTEAPSEESDTLTEELGLDQEQEIAPGWGDGYATEFSGTRHGRQVALRIGVYPRIVGGFCNEVQLDTPVVPFRVRVSDDRPTVESGGTPELMGILAGLTAAPKVWRKLEVEGGPDGIIARRLTSAHPQGYLYDLWLIERIADALGT